MRVREIRVKQIRVNQGLGVLRKIGFKKNGARSQKESMFQKIWLLCYIEKTLLQMAETKALFIKIRNGIVKSVSKKSYTFANVYTSKQPFFWNRL